MIENLEGEIWMQHPKWNWLAASNYGRIKSIERDVYKKDGITEHRQEKLRHPSPGKDGYLRFTIKNKKLGINDVPLVHRFVWEAFNQELIPDDLEINHLDCNRSNNQISNLELIDHQSNMDYSVSKKVGQYKLNGDLVKVWKSTNEAGRNGFDQSNITKCCRGESKKHHNFIWKYIEE